MKNNTVVKRAHKLVMATIKCNICKELLDSDDELCKLSCGHLFDRICIEKWVVQSSHCPVCLKKCNDQDIIRLHDSSENNNNSDDDGNTTDDQQDNNITYSKKIEELNIITSCTLENLQSETIIYGETCVAKSHTSKVNRQAHRMSSLIKEIDDLKIAFTEQTKRLAIYKQLIQVLQSNHKQLQHWFEENKVIYKELYRKHEKLLMEFRENLIINEELKHNNTSLSLNKELLQSNVEQHVKRKADMETELNELKKRFRQALDDKDFMMMKYINATSAYKSDSNDDKNGQQEETNKKCDFILLEDEREIQERLEIDKMIENL